MGSKLRRAEVSGDEQQPVDHQGLAAGPLDLQGLLGNQEMLARLRQQRTALEALAPRAPLPHRQEAEDTFGAKLGDVEAIQGVPEIEELFGAHALTDGEVVLFSDKNPAPEEVIHEVAHVEQERGVGGGGGGSISAKSGASEREAAEAVTAYRRGETSEVEERRDGGLSRNPGALAAPLWTFGGGASLAPLLPALGVVALVGLVAYGGYVLLSKATGNQLDTGLRDLSDEEVKSRARDRNLSGEERRRYQREEKARGDRNKRKRNENTNK
jgi:hypothetical protein